MNVIDSYQFGQVVVNGKRYTSDAIIFPDRVKDRWRRRISHQLCLDEIAEAIDESPEVLIVGNGASGMMKVLPEVKEGADAHGIRLVVEATDKACHTYNQLCHSQKVIAALHLTC